MRRVGINLLYLVPGRVGGTEIYARELLRALAEARPDVSFSAFCGHEAARGLSGVDWPENVDLVRLPVRQRVKPLRVAAEFSLLAAAADRGHVELLHSFGTTSPPLTRAARVVTVHDLIYEHVRESFPGPARAGLKVLVPIGARRAHRVLVPSRATARDVEERLRVPHDRIDVVPYGVGRPPAGEVTAEEALRSRFGLGAGPVVLSVAAALPHKNLERLIAAFTILPRHLRQEATLVLVGHAGRITERLRNLALSAGIEQQVRLTGWISDADLEGLYRIAHAFAYPTLIEGFGMPVLEAMVRGVPVACSDASALPEVAGDAALLFDPLSVETIASAIATLIDDRTVASELRTRGFERAKQFSWTRTATGTLKTYEAALAVNAPRSGAA